MDRSFTATLTWLAAVAIGGTTIEGSNAQEAARRTPTEAAQILLQLSPPIAPGCYLSSAKVTEGAAPKWKRVPCMSQREMRDIPRPTVGGSAGIPSIQSQPRDAAERHELLVAGIATGQVGVHAPSAGSTEKDSKYGTFEFSVQLNTNSFSPTCHFAHHTCIPSDTTVVQFTYETTNGQGRHDNFCVWIVLTKSPQQYFPFCIKTGHAPGFWTASQLIYVAGKVDFIHHNLVLTAELPWSNTVSVVAHDYFGLCWTPGPSPQNCAWNQVSGTILGVGNGTQAIFSPPGTSVTTDLYAVTCNETVDQSVCNSSVDVLNPYLGAASTLVGTNETNNLTVPPAPAPTANCFGTLCILSFTATVHGS
jgi:hypothetical protein